MRARKRAFQLLADGLTDAAREALEALLTFDPELGRSHFAWLRDYAESPAPSNIVALLDRLDYVRGLGIEASRAERIHPARLRQLLDEGAIMTVQHIADLEPVRRTAILVAQAADLETRLVFFHRQGEIRDRTFENQSFRASGLSLITAAIVHWNTVYLDRAVQHLRAQGADVPDDLLAHVAPLGWEHVALTGDYVWTVAHPVPGFRPLRDVRSTFLLQAA